MMKTNWRQYLPQAIRERIEVNTYLMNRILAEEADKLPPQSYVLDAGAGEGRFQQLFAHTHYFAIDLAVGDLTWDYSQLSALNTLEQLCFPDNTFDAVICVQVLEHLAEPAAVLAELQRVLRPGGCLFLIAPQSWHEHQIPHDFFRYTSYGLRHLLQKAGFEVETMRALGGYYWYLSFQLQTLPYWTFSRNHPTCLPAPLQVLLKLLAIGLCEVVLPLLLFFLDRHDQVQEATLGHFCLARKPT